MKHIQIAQHTIKELFQQNKTRFFVIPFYQRPYSWTEEQCSALWYDIEYFAFPDGHADKFNEEIAEWFLGNLVTYPSDVEKFPNKLEVVDGQQRIITLLLLMRALYEELHDTDTGKDLGKCIWVFSEGGKLDVTTPRILSNAIMEMNNQSLTQILVSGNVSKIDKCNYAVNYRYFRDQINDFKTKTPNNLWKFAERLMDNVCVSRMEADSEDQALQLFLTINDRGMSLRIADIFQAKLFEHIKNTVSDEEAYNFLNKWQNLCDRCNKIFRPGKELSPIEYIFLLYACTVKKKVDWRKLKQIYGRNDYALLKAPQTLKDIDELLNFFGTLYEVGKQLAVPNDIAQKVHILFRGAPYVVWYLLTIYFFKHRKEHGNIFDENLSLFLERALAFLVCAVLRGESFSFKKHFKLFSLMPWLMSGDVLPDEYKISKSTIQQNMTRFFEIRSIKHGRNLLLAWWTFRDENQPRIPWKTELEIEHIFAKKLAANRTLHDPNNIELLGNLALLEKSLNRKSQNFTLADKVKFYGKSHNKELYHLAEIKDDFTEADILARNELMTKEIIALLGKNGFLLQDAQLYPTGE